MKEKQLDDTTVLDDLIPNADEKKNAVWVNASEEKEKMRKRIWQGGGKR